MSVRSASRFFSSSTKTADLEYRCRIAPRQQQIYHLIRDAVLSTGGILEVNPTASCGTYRVIVRHGVSRVRSGQRQTLGLIRDAR